MKTGGRGKAGGVKLANDADEAAEKATGILGLDIKGHVVRRVLVTEASDIADEYYVSYLLDRANRTYLAMASVEGGMEIEQLAVERPDGAGPDPGRPDRRASTRPRRPRSPTPPASRPTCGDQVDRRRWSSSGTSSSREDATLVEVNPLVKTPDGQVVALDGKVTLDDNAAFRHADHGPVRRTRRRATRWSSRPRRRTSTTSSSTARSASSATGPAWSCPPSTWWPTPGSSTAASARPTSSTSAAVRRPR